jgi:multiple sugar transport system ATP-binding protein
MFVAEFIGSPPMNFLRFEGMVGTGATAVRLGEAEVAVPALRRGTTGRLALGVRPEHVHLDDGAAYRGRVVATEYLGTTQIVTLRTAHGEVKARTPATHPARPGETVGLAFDARTLTIFDAGTGKALVSAANERVLRHG